MSSQLCLLITRNNKFLIVHKQDPKKIYGELIEYEKKFKFQPRIDPYFKEPYEFSRESLIQIINSIDYLKQSQRVFVE